jgi:hypothetical protein
MWMRDSFGRTVRPSGPAAKAADEYGSVLSRHRAAEDAGPFAARSPAAVIELEPTDHPLAVEQRRGISQERFREIALMHMHAGDLPAA